MQPQDMSGGMGGGMSQRQDQPDPSQDPNAQSGQSGQDAMSHFDTYEELRKALLQLHMMGLPGADKLIIALEKIHTENIAMANQNGAQGGKAGVASPQASGQYGQAPSQGQ